ncbi:MAG TPA: carboxypeptidase-like regulatory domain-containing protein [Pyrinomonadaceae bacterium]|jgi:hypothetical protein
MKKENSLKSSFLWKMAFIAAMLLIPATLINAQTCTPQTFAQFQQNPASQAFTFNQGSGTFTGQSQAIFQYSNILGLPGELSGPQNATVIISASTTAAAFNSGNQTFQPFNGTFTIQILRSSAASVGSGSRTNLLTATVNFIGNPSTITGLTGQAVNSAAYSAAQGPQNITYTSDFINFSGAIEKNLALSFSSIVQRYFLSFGSTFVDTFQTAATGTFDVCPNVRFTPPVAADAEIGGRVLTPSGAGLAKARVSLTLASGETLNTMTNSFGYYKFTNIEAGQSVIVSVTSKRYRYSPKVLNVGEDLANSDFIPE